ncbi:MAG: O-antigen ligase family protein [Thermoanaerobaculia bacterium]
MSQDTASRAYRFARGSYLLHLWTLFGLALSNGLLGLAALATPWAARGNRERWRRLAPIAPPLLLYVAALLMAILGSHDPVQSLQALGEVFNLATLVLAPLLLAGLRQARLAVDGILWGSGAFAVWGLVQFFVLGYGDLDQRIRGPFSHWMTFAGLLLLADFLLIARLTVRSDARRRWFWWALLVLLNVALVVSLTRGAWVALAITVTALLALKAPRLLPAYLPAAALFLLLAPAPVVSRVVSIGDLRYPSNYERLCMLEAGFQMVRQQPLFGVGPDMVDELYPLYRHPTSQRPRAPHLHNTFLQLAAERGIVSLAAYLWLMGAILWLAYRGYRRAGPGDVGRAELLLGVLLGLVAFNCAGLFEDNWGDTEVQRVVLLLAALPLVLSGSASEDRAG